MNSAALRILDANANRLREALRVLEEHARFILDDPAMTERLKRARHALAAILADLPEQAMLAARDVAADEGAVITLDSEQVRSSSVQVALASAKRAAEALRCLEEYAKLDRPDAVARFKALRYDVYAIEQDMFVAAPRRRLLRNARLHVLVTESACAAPWERVCRAVIDAGAGVIQLREKQLSDAELLRRARLVREWTAAADVLLIINDRPDIARLCDADGVHVGQNDLPVAEARRIAGPARLVGKSTHSIAEIDAAVAECPDYVAVGPMFPSRTKPAVPVQGPALLDAALARFDGTLVAIGGIDPSNVRALPRDPRVHCAVSQAVIGASDPARAVQDLLAEINLDRSGGPAA